MVSFKVHFIFRDFSIYMYDFRHCTYIEYTVYNVYTVYRGGAKILVRGGNIGKKISYMNSFQVLYCNGVAKISIGGHSAQMYSSKTFENF